MPKVCEMSNDGVQPMLPQNTAHWHIKYFNRRTSCVCVCVKHSKFNINIFKYLLSAYIQTYPENSSSKNDLLSLSELSSLSHEPHKRDTLPKRKDF